MRPGYSVQDYAKDWIRASEIIQRSPGARGTYLHRKIGDPDVLLAIASWDSKAHRDAWNTSSEIVRAIKEHVATQCDIALIGEFEEPEWAVLPL